MRAAVFFKARVVIAAAGEIKSIDLSDCGLNKWFLPAPIVARLPHLQELIVIDTSKDSSLRLPPAQVCSGGVEAIKRFFTRPERKELEVVALEITSQLDSSSSSAADVIDIINALWNQEQEDAPVMAQQLWVSLVSHKSSNEYATAVEMFLDEHLDDVAAVMKWKDHSGRTAAATALSSCKRAMSSRAFFMGMYDIPQMPDGVQHEYKSATCTVYIVDRVEEDKRTRVALKFMKHADEFEREKSSREKLTAAGLAQEQTLQDYIIDTIDSYHCTDAAFCAAVEKHRWLVDYDNPCLLVMPAADRNLRDIMDKERITSSDVIKTIFHEILKCVKFMHERGYIHGDLKPRNLMRVVVDSKRHILLIDLDASAATSLQYSWSKHSSAYMPPEAIRLSLSLVCDDLLVSGAPTSSQFTVDFKFSLPIDVVAGSTFTIKFSPVNVTGVLSLMLDDAVDLSSCMSVKDQVITVTAKGALALGSRRFTMVATFNGNPTAAGSVSARLEHVVNTLRPVRGASKDSLPKCTVTIRTPMKEGFRGPSSQWEQQVSSSKSPSAVAERRNQSRPESSPRPLHPHAKRAPSAPAALTPPYPPFLSESAIESMTFKLPSVPVDALSPTVAKAATLMQDEYSRMATNVQREMRSLRQAWELLNQISAVASGANYSFSWLSCGSSVSSNKRDAGNASLSPVETEPVAAPPLASPVALEHAARAPDVPCECTCDQVLPPGMRSGDASIPAGCTGLCGLAHVSHDMWALGVILYRFCARQSLFYEDDEDNIKDGSGYMLELALWTDAFKQERLQKIDDTATRELVSKLLEKEPWKRPRSIDDVLALPFNEADVIKLKLQETVPYDAHQSSNFVGSVKDLRTGKFSDAAFGLRPYLKVADDWDEAAACTLQGMQDEVELLKDCADCARVQADVLQQLGRSEAAATQKLASALAELKEQRKKRAPLTAGDTVKKLRAEISAADGWHYGMQNSIQWKDGDVKVDYGTFTKIFIQPMCSACKAYNLDYSSISADLRYIIHEPAVEKKEWNGVRDRGRAGRCLKDFMHLPQAKASRLKEAELVALRFYTSHSFNALNIPMRDFDRQGPHPLPAIMMNIQTALKKLRALGADDASSKQTVVLWRGMSYMQLPQKFSAEGGTELAPMSTTTDVSVAISYAVKKDTRSALLFRFVTRNNLERGADVQWLSMFPGESETLFPPLTFLQRTRTEPQDVVHNGVKVTIVELSATLA